MLILIKAYMIKLHTPVLIGFGVLIFLTMVSASFGDEYAKKGVEFWALYMAFYFPFYVAYADNKGEIFAKKLFIKIKSR